VEDKNATIIILGAYRSQHLSFLKTVSANEVIGDKP